MTPPCPFCTPDPTRVFFQGKTVFALWDAYPLTDGHALIVPRRHIGSWFEATGEEQAEMLEAVSVVRQEIEGSRSPDGYNVGMNLGAAGPVHAGAGGSVHPTLLAAGRAVSGGGRGGAAAAEHRPPGGGGQGGAGGPR